jgi:DNA-binding transcriptional LysR family regulator
MIELQDLRCFLTVVHEQHMGRAARRLNMAQAPLTRQLRGLERSLGITLFERSSPRVELTPAGAALADGVRRTLSELERAVDRAQRTGGAPDATLRVCSPGYASDAVATELLGRFRAEHPSVRVDIEGESTEPVLRALRRGAIDVAFMLGPVDADITAESGLRALLVHRERFVAALPPHHRLAGGRPLSLRGLAGEPLVVLARAVAPRFHELIGAACHGAGFTTTIAAEAQSFDAVLAEVADGRGIGLVPASLAAREPRELSVRPLNGMTATVDIALVYRSGDESTAVQRLVAAV